MKIIFYNFLILIAATGSLSYGAAAPAFDMQELHTSLAAAEKEPIELILDSTDNMVEAQTNALAEFANRHPVDLIVRWEDPRTLVPKSTKEKSDSDGNLLIYSKRFAGYAFDHLGRVDIMKIFEHTSRNRYSNSKGIRSRGKRRAAISTRDCQSKWIRIAPSYDPGLSDDEADIQLPFMEEGINENLII